METMMMPMLTLVSGSSLWKTPVVALAHGVGLNPLDDNEENITTRQR